MTKELLKRFKQVGIQDTSNPIIIAKYFNPQGAGTWYATEFDPASKVFFGYVSIFGDYNDEWGSFSLDELEQFTGNMGLGIERDLYFNEIRYGDLPEMIQPVQKELFAQVQFERSRQ
jgi:hypothetical protein